MQINNTQEKLSIKSKAFDLAVLAYGAITIAALLPIIGGIISAGVDILNVPSWVFGAGGSFLAASAICYPFCNEKGKSELRKAAPALLAMTLLSLPVYFVTGFSAQDQQTSPINIPGMLKDLGRICIGFSVFFVPLFLWMASLAALVKTLESKADASQS